jgi:ubiquinone/menaquinone biosynthesis C-methylase UbiE
MDLFGNTTPLLRRVLRAAGGGALIAVAPLWACTPALVEPAPHSHAHHQETHERKGGHDATSSHPFDDVDRWVSIFDSPERDAWQKPAEVVRVVGLKPGDRVADLGAGTGYFLPHLSGAVREQGTVWALDTESKMVEHMKERAAEEGWGNVHPLMCPEDSPGLPDGSVDLVLIVDTYHHINDRLSYLPRLERTLLPGGRVAIVDFRKDVPPPPGPPVEHRLDREFVISEFLESGWILDDEYDILDYQYILIFRPGSSQD